MELAVQLHRQDLLSAVFSTFPLWKLKRFGLPKQKLHSTTWLHAVQMAKFRCLGSSALVDPFIGHAIVRLHTQYLLKHLPSCDVLVALSGSGLEAGKVVQQRGGKYICDRGSAHIRFVDNILAEEFSIWGQSFPAVGADIVSREEQEYAIADMITVPSTFAARSFIDMGVPVEKVATIPYGVDVRRFQKVADAPDDRFEVLFVGAVSFQKGVPYLLQAFASLKHPRKRLRLVGAVQGEMVKFLQNNRFDDIEFLGPLPQTDLIPIMSSSHVFVLPSVQDGFGMVLSQAMACGCPVICSTNTAAHDLIEEGREGFIVPIRDPRAILIRLEQLCQDAALQRRMGEVALQRVKSVGGWDHYGAQFGALCTDLAHRVETPVL
jgi:glycosyltransferase involved in cell wall biosynthesis